MRLQPTAIVLAALMCCTSVAGVVTRPTATTTNPPRLELNVPKRFGGWAELQEKGVQVSDPRADELVRTLYGEILSRSYVNQGGYRIMLSLAWGANQTGNLQAHRPEVCYPAQGFKLLMKKDGKLATTFGSIDVVRLDTVLGTRHEPVTYWLTNGNQVVRTPWDQRMAQIRLWMTGEVPDGLLFRISSIDADTDQAYAMQQKFAADLLASVPAKFRTRLSGLESNPTVAVGAAPRRGLPGSGA
jgi:EpsI family protein